MYKEVYILTVRWDLHGDRDSDILGVYAQEELATQEMNKDVASTLHDWDDLQKRWHDKAGACYENEDAGDWCEWLIIKREVEGE